MNKTLNVALLAAVVSVTAAFIRADVSIKRNADAIQALTKNVADLTRLYKEQDRTVKANEVWDQVRTCVVAGNPFTECEDRYH